MPASRSVLLPASLASLCLVFSAPRIIAGASLELLTLSQAVKEALMHNDRLVNQDDAIERANLGVALAHNAFRPKVVPNIQGSFGQTDVSNQNYRLDLSQRFTTGTEVRFGVGASTSQIPGDPAAGGQTDIRFYNADTTLMVSQPLLRGFGQAVGGRSVTSAELRQRDAARAKALGEQEVTVEVASAYYRLVAHQALVAVALTSLERSRRLLDASTAKLEAGLVSQLDVFRAQQLLSQAELQYFDAQSGTEDARDMLCFLIGRPSGTPFDVTLDIPKAVDAMPAQEAVALALERRLDLQGAAAAAADSERAIAFARNQLLPQLDVSLSVIRRQTAPTFGKSFGLNQFQVAPFFSLSMPVDRTPQHIDFQNALIERDRHVRQVDLLRSRIGDDVRRALRNRERVSRTLSAAEAGVDISRKEVEVAQLRYERGLSNNLDVVTAEAGLLSAESRRLAVLADLAVANLSLRATLGILDPRTDFAEADATRR